MYVRIMPNVCEFLLSETESSVKKRVRVVENVPASTSGSDKTTHAIPLWDELRTWDPGD